MAAASAANGRRLNGAGVATRSRRGDTRRSTRAQGKRCERCRTPVAAARSVRRSWAQQGAEAGARQALRVECFRVTHRREVASLCSSTTDAGGTALQGGTRELAADAVRLCALQPFAAQVPDQHSNSGLN